MQAHAGLRVQARASLLAIASQVGERRRGERALQQVTNERCMRACAGMQARARLVTDAPQVGERDEAGGRDLRGRHLALVRVARREARAALALLPQPEGLAAEREGWRDALQVVQADELRVAQLHLRVPVAALRAQKSNSKLV